MIGIVLALGSAFGYGVSDFIGGVASRRASAWAVAVAAQAAAASVVFVVALTRPGQPDLADFLWAVGAGLGNALGTAFLYRGFAGGRIAVVAPISAVGSALVPVLAGVVGGERPGPLVWCGIAAALPGIWLVARTADEPPPDGREVPAGSAVRDGCLAGLGFGIVFAGLGQIPESAGLGPLALCQLVAVAGVVALALAAREACVPRGFAAWGGGIAGLLGGCSTLLYLLSAQSGSITVAAILTALYPAVTIVLAAALLREHVRAAQGLGLALCAAAVALVAAG